MFKRQSPCGALWMAGGWPAVVFCCYAAVLPVPAGAHPKSEPTAAPAPTLPPPAPQPTAPHGTDKGPPPTPKADTAPNDAVPPKVAVGPEKKDAAPEKAAAPKADVPPDGKTSPNTKGNGNSGHKDQQANKAPKDAGQAADTKPNGGAGHGKGADQKEQKPPKDAAKGSSDGHGQGAHGNGKSKGEAASPPAPPPPLGQTPPPHHHMSSGAQLGGPIADGLTTPTSSVADALASIAAAPASTQSGSDPSDMMRLGAGAARSKTGAGALQLAPTIGTFQPNEILGHHLGAGVRQQLSAAQKYRIEAGHTDSVTRLVLPDYLSLTDELAKLQARFPDQLFGLNYLYASYRGAGESSGEPPLPAGKEHGCEAARCYGPAMIGWHSDLTTCARNVVVGIIDTGLDAKHPALKGLHVIQHPQDAQSRGDNWHGTGIAALLAGARESSTPGLIPDAQYVVVDAFFASGTEETSAGAKPDEQSRQTITNTDHLIWALETLQQKGAEVVNMSLVGPSDPAIHAEIRKMARSGVVFVAAAGNGGPAGAPAYPAAYPEVIAVTAVDRNKHGYAEANHGTYIDVAAPGVRVWTALPGDRQGFLSGTSFAAPFVTAIAAATYNATPMKAAARGQDHPYNPKGEMIGRMAVEKLGAGGPGTRDSVFGLGLARAPETCAPRAPQAPIAAAPAPTAADPVVLTSGESAWRTQVHHASSAR